MLLFRSRFTPAAGRSYRVGWKRSSEAPKPAGTPLGALVVLRFCLPIRPLLSGVLEPSDSASWEMKRGIWVGTTSTAAHPALPSLAASSTW